MSSPTSARLRTRYVVRWQKLAECVALAAALFVWIGFLLHGG